MYVRELRLDSDYLTACQWWHEDGQNILPKHMMPPEGVVIEKNGHAILMSFLLTTSSSIAFILFTVRHPMFGAPMSTQAQAMAFKELERVARDKGCKILASVSENARLTNNLQESGLEHYPEASFLMKDLCGGANGKKN